MYLQLYTMNFSRRSPLKYNPSSAVTIHIRALTVVFSVVTPPPPHEAAR